MKFNRKLFFDEYRERFKAPTPAQVAGIERLLTGFETYNGWWDNVDQIANAFAQVKHETNESFMPVVEGYYLARSTPPDYTGKSERVKHFQEGLRYYPHFGMGDIQLTWKENYAEQDHLIRKYFPERVSEFEKRAGQKFDMIKNPRQALDPWISFCVFTIGMCLGTFREGHTLDRYINAKNVDHFTARNIVNGDRFYKIQGSNIRIGDKIASDAKKFAAIMRESLVVEDKSSDDAHNADTAQNLLDEAEPRLAGGSWEPDAPQPAPESAPSYADGGPVPQSRTDEGGDKIDTQINLSTDKAEKQKLDQAANSGPVIATTEEKVGFWGKFTAIISGIATGTYVIPKVDPEMLDLVKAFAPYLLVVGVLALGWWYYTKKITNQQRLDLFVRTNADQTLRDVKFVAPASKPLIPQSVTPLLSAVYYAALIALIIAFR